MKVATWNVESIRAHHDQVIAWVERNEPDVLCLQETKCVERQFPKREFVARGYDLVIHGGTGGRGGVAIASRSPIDDVTLGIPGAIAPLNQDLSISCTVGGIRLHTCYAPNGRKVATPAHAIKLAWFALFDAWLEMDRAEHERQLVVGDFNIAPLDIDIWEPARYRKRNLTSPPERKAFEALVNDDELIDVVRQHFGDRHVYTWWNRRSDFYESDRGWRLDHVLADPTTASRVESVVVDRAERGREGSTDHAPILVELGR